MASWTGTTTNLKKLQGHIRSHKEFLASCGFLEGEKWAAQKDNCCFLKSNIPGCKIRTTGVIRLSSQNRKLKSREVMWLAQSVIGRLTLNVQSHYKLWNVTPEPCGNLHHPLWLRVVGQIQRWAPRSSPSWYSNTPSPFIYELPAI